MAVNSRVLSPNTVFQNHQLRRRIGTRVFQEAKEKLGGALGQTLRVASAEAPSKTLGALLPIRRIVPHLGDFTEEGCSENCGGAEDLVLCEVGRLLPEAQWRRLLLQPVGIRGRHIAQVVHYNNGWIHSRSGGRTEGRYLSQCQRYLNSEQRRQSFEIHGVDLRLVRNVAPG